MLGASLVSLVLLALPTDPPPSPASLHLADLTGDGRLEKLVVAPDGTLSVAVNLGGGRFAPPLGVEGVPGGATPLASDLDGDGLTDLYLVAPGVNVALLGDGQGGLREATEALGLADTGEGRFAERVDLDGLPPHELILHNAGTAVLFWGRPGGFDRDPDSPQSPTPPAPGTLGGSGSGGGNPGTHAGPSHTGTLDGPSPLAQVGLLPSLMDLLDERYVNEGAGEVDGGVDLVDGTITAAKLASGSVTSAAMADDAIKSAQVVDGGITGVDLALATLDGSHLASSSLSGAHIVNGSLTGADLGNSTITSAHVADKAIGTNDLATDAVTSAILADASVKGGAIAQGVVTGFHLAPSAVTSAALADGAVTGADLAPGVLDATHMATGAVGTAQILDGDVWNDDLGFWAVTGDKIFPGTITGDKLAEDTITHWSIGDGQVYNVHLAPNAVDTSQLQTAAVTGAKLSAGAVDTSHLATNAVTGVGLAPDAVTGTHVVDGSLSGADISVSSGDVSHDVDLFDVDAGQRTYLTNASAGWPALAVVKKVQQTSPPGMESVASFRHDAAENFDRIGVDFSMRGADGLWHVAGGVGAVIESGTGPGQLPVGSTQIFAAADDVQIPVLTATANGWVGIGDTSPDHALDVEGSFAATGSVRAHSGTALNAAYKFSGNGDWTGMFSDQGEVAVTIQGNETLRVAYGSVGIDTIPSFAYALDVNGDLRCDWISKGGGTFKIDHPLDPANKYLSHSFVESPEMLNVYNGTVELDALGMADVSMPEWFEALNTEFRYQLTCVGGFAPIYVAHEIEGNAFTIAGGTPGLKVCWQVTGVRQDAFALANPVVVEEQKEAVHRGHYLHPEAWGQPASAGEAAARLAEREAQQALEQTIEDEG
jgi:uncharacterized protein YjbI with pentapeptide repeats